MSLSGEVGAAETSVVALNEGNPEGPISLGKTCQATKPKLWSEFSDDEDNLDCAEARAQLRKVCLASVGVRPGDELSPLQRTKAVSTSYVPSASPTRRGHSRRGHHVGPGFRPDRRSRQDNLAIWQEAAAASRATPVSSKQGPAAGKCAPTTKRRFGGLSLDALMSYDKTSVKSASDSIEKPVYQQSSEKQPLTASSHPHSCKSTDNQPAANTAEYIGNLSISSSSPVKSLPSEPSFGRNSSKRLPSMERRNKMVTSSEASTKSSADTDAEEESDSVSGTEECISTAKQTESSVTKPSVTAHQGSMSASSDEEVFDIDAPVEPRLQEVNGDVIFEDVFDIWFTQPLGGTRRGLAKEVYENGMHLIGSFKTLSQFFDFHGMLEWDDLPPSSVIAFCRHGIKPIWEDPRNEAGGRFLVKNFRRDETESVFTKIALGFFSGMLHDWKNYNLISLHIRESRRGSDIQLWRSVVHSRHLTTQRVKADLADFVENSQPGMTLSFVPNRESLSRNDSRLQQQSGHRKGKGRRSAAQHSVSTTAVYTGGSCHPVFHLYSQKGGTRSVLGDAQKAALAKEAAASLLEAAPQFQQPQGSDLEATCTGSNLTPVTVEESASMKRKKSFPEQTCDDGKDLARGEFRTTNASAENSGKAYLGQYPYSYRYFDEQAPLQYAHWYESPHGYWMPNCAPPDTFCLMPYPYPAYTYTSKGTTYYPLSTSLIEESSENNQQQCATPTLDPPKSSNESDSVIAADSSVAVTE
eukprot:Gregarina_sp_Poly_1__2741@NODE_175_length_12037_cov_139_596324_g155_i0_p2_GENE_NODE_175_length_12037_cov_139_596324_g155_i0NODE_175_length_12037_cov_139_596324_g155_i0_p2_ORF_typecomplete_len753_score109_61IF4E/PF01652_18/2_6e03IF4E/PF01652_18/1_8e15_NODE_175_length_12037_cov_139_596324_g155_i04922750